MGIYRVDGGRNINPGSGVPQSSSLPTFDQALSTAKKSSDQALASRDPQQLTQAEEDWAVVQAIEENEYRIAAASADPASAIAALDKKYGRTFRNNGAETEMFDKVTANAKTTVQNESPSDRTFNLSLYQAQSKTSAAYDKLKAASGDEQSAAYTEYANAVKDLINLQLQHELEKLPAGPDGSHTLDQWKQAAQAAAKNANLTGDAAKIYDHFALVSGYLDQIKHNPSSLNLTPTEQELAKNDPVTLAFVKAAGINLDDPKLSPEMQEIAKKNPVFLTFLQVSGAEIYINNDPVVKETIIGQLTNGQYLHVKINDTMITDQKLIDQLAGVYKQTDPDNRIVAVAGVLVANLHPENNQTLQTLTMAADNARMQDATAGMKALTSGQNPDIKTVISFFSTQLNGFFDPGAREAFWNNSGKPYFTEDVFRKRFEQFLKKPDPMSDSPEDQRELNNPEIYADKIGRDAQDLLKGAPKEIRTVILHALMHSFDKKWYQANQMTSGSMPRFEEFYKALSMAVEPDPGADPEDPATTQDAKDAAAWLMDRNGPQNGILTTLWDPQLRNWEGVKRTMEQGYGPTLSKTLLAEVQKNPDFENMEYFLKIRVDQGWDKIKDDYEKKIYSQDYQDLIDNESKVLVPYFQSFLNDKNIGRPGVDVKNDTQLHDMIGKALGLAPTNTQAAAALDYTQEWYAPSDPNSPTPEWNTILSITKLLHQEGGDHLKLNALPVMFASRGVGTQKGAMFILTKAGGQQEFIDGTAIMNAVAMHGGKQVGGRDVNDGWNYASFEAFQDDNHSYGGDIYVPTDFRIDFNDDGKITSDDYEKKDAAVTTFNEHLNQAAVIGLAVTGGVLLFVPGAQAAGVGLLMAAGATQGLISAGEIATVGLHGGNWSPFNPQLRMQYANVLLAVLPFGRLGILTKFAEGGAWATKAPGFALFMRGGVAPAAGGTASFLGVTMTATQVQSLATNWNNPDFTWVDKTLAVASLASTLAMVRLAGANVKPVGGVGYDPVGKYGPSSVASAGKTGYRAFKIWDDGGNQPGGLVTDLWTRAKTNLNNLAQPAYKAWNDAGRIGEEWWIKAREPYVSQIEADAHAAWAADTAPGRPATWDVNAPLVARRYIQPAEQPFADKIATAAFHHWNDAGRPKIWEDASGTRTTVSARNAWTKSSDGKAFHAQILKAQQLWRAQQSFMSEIGENGVRGNANLKTAGNPEQPWFVEARNTRQPDIEAIAKKLHSLDPNPKKNAWSNPEYMGPAEGLIAYQIWNEGRSGTFTGRQLGAQTQIDVKKFNFGKVLPWRWRSSGGLRPWKLTNARSTLTYQQWVRINQNAGKATGSSAPPLTRLTTTRTNRAGDEVIINDVAVRADTQRVMQIPGRSGLAKLPGFKPFSWLTKFPRLSGFTPFSRFSGLSRFSNSQTFSEWASTKLLPSELKQTQIDRLGPWLNTTRTATPSPSLAGLGLWTRLTRGTLRALQFRGTRLRLAQIVSGERIYLQQKPTDVVSWLEAEKLFKLRIGKSTFNDWKVNRSLGAEDAYFAQANDYYRGEIATEAYSYFTDSSKFNWDLGPRKMSGRFLNGRMQKGPVYEFWKTNKTKIDGEITAAGADWVSNGRSVTEPEWAAAVRDLDTAIQNKATQLQTTAGPSTTKTRAQFVEDAQDALAGYIAQKAFANWLKAGSPTTTNANWTTAVATLNESTGLPAYTKWAEAGFPDGWRNTPWTMGRRSVKGTEPGERLWVARQRLTDFRTYRQMQLNRRGGLGNTLGMRQFLTQTASSIKTTGKWYGMAYAGTNLVGIAGWAATNYGMDERRTTAMGSADVELQALLADPQNYIKNNYENTLFGTPIGDVPVLGMFAGDDWGSQSDGHVMAFVGADNKMKYFQRIPKDLYDLFSKSPATSAPRLSILDDPTDLNVQTKIFVNDGKLYIYEPLKLSGVGDFTYSDLNPLAEDPTKLPDEIKEQIGVRAYQLWAEGGRPQGSPVAVLWSQAEEDFRKQTGTDAYKAWKAAPPGGATVLPDTVWTQAVADFRKQIDDDAQKAWNDDKTPGKPTTWDDAKYVAPAEQNLGDEIAMHAYTYWNQSGRNSQTSGASVWKGAEPDFLPKIGTPAYNAVWIARQAFQGKMGLPSYSEWSRTRPVGGADAVWGTALNDFKPQIDEEAKQLWKDAGQLGAGPTQDQYQQAEINLGAQISMQAYEYWNLAGRNAQTKGADVWAQNEGDYKTALGAPVFDAWNTQRSPQNVQPASWPKNDGFWAGAVTDWQKDGQPILQLVQLRAPFKDEGNPFTNPDANLPRSSATGTVAGVRGWRERLTWALGPIEGMRIHLNLEGTLNYPYTTPTASTFRVGGPSPTQGWNWDIRQQDTTLWSRVNVSAGSIEYNGAQVFDLSDASRDGWTVMNSRLYLDLGYRNRARFDPTGKYLHFRETGFVELGLGADFFKVTSGSQTFNINGYYELQFYPGDFRTQLTWKNSSLASTRSFQEGLPLLGIDPAFQITWSDERLRLVDLPASAPVR